MIQPASCWNRLAPPILIVSAVQGADMLHSVDAGSLALGAGRLCSLPLTPSICWPG